MLNLFPWFKNQRSVLGGLVLGLALRSCERTTAQHAGTEPTYLFSYIWLLPGTQLSSMLSDDRHHHQRQDGGGTYASACLSTR